MDNITHMQPQPAYIHVAFAFLLSCVCDRDVECGCATLLRPIWRALNLYRFPFRDLSFSISGASPCPPPFPSAPCNTISPINSSAFKTHCRIAVVCYVQYCAEWSVLAPAGPHVSIAYFTQKRKKKEKENKDYTTPLAAPRGRNKQF